MNNVVINPYEYFADPTQGRPIFNGFVYIGQPDTDPEVPANQKQVYARQENGSEVAIAQPVRTNAGGYPTYNGSVIAIIVDGPHSLKVNNKDGSQVLYNSNNYNGIATTEDYGSVLLATDAQAIAGTPDVIPDAEQVRKNHVAQVATIADLRALEPAFDRQEVSLGEHTAGTGLGGGMFYADYSSSAADDDGVAIVTAGGKRWVRKVNGFVMPQMFGAYGDGVNDDTSAIQAALTSYDAVYFPSGVYKISNTIYYKTNNKLFGDGDSSLIQLSSGLVKNMFYPIGPFGTVSSPNSYSLDNVIFRDLCIDHNITDASDFVESIMTINALSVKHFLVDNVHFRNPSGDCIYISNRYGGDKSTGIPYDIKIVNSRFSGNNINRNAISVITAYNMVIEGNHFYKITKSNMPCPIDLEPDNISETIINVSIANNTFDGCKGGVATYITATGPTDYASIRNISIVGNNFYNQYNITPYVAETQAYIAIYNASNVTVEGNNLYAAADLGIDISKSKNITCQGNNIFGPSLFGLRVKDVFDLKFDGNTIIMLNDTFNGNACYAIGVDTNGFVAGTNYSWVGGSLRGNTIKSEVVTPASNGGLLIQGNFTDVDMEGVVEGFYTGLYFGKRSAVSPSNNKINMDITNNTTPFLYSMSTDAVNTKGEYKLGNGLTYGVSSFSASTNKVITGLPIRTSSIVRVTRIGSTALGNTLTGACPANGQLTVTSSGAETGSFLWEIVQL